MTTLVPNRFLFDIEFPLAYRAKLPRIDGKLAEWEESDRLPDLGQLESKTSFAQVWACWNESGLSFAFRVEGKKRSLRCDPKSFWKGDNIRICTDMRDARANKRATKYCQQFYLLPTGGGRSKKEAVAGVNPIQRARQEAPHVPVSRISIAALVTKTGYTLEAHLPAECLSGFDPEAHSRIGFYYIIEDVELGKQYLTVGDDLYWFVDPSTWATAVLAR